MSTEFVDNAYKTGAGRYLQQADALSLLDEEVQRFGTKAFLLGGQHTMAACEDEIVAVLKAARIPFISYTYTGFNSYEAADKLTSLALQNNCDVIVGIGGGRIMDLAKATAATSNLPLIEIPTNTATCSAFTPLSVMYTNNGAFKNTWRYQHEIDAVIVDTRIMALQPPRLVAAGILDSMAKVFEIAHGSADLNFEKESVQRFCAYEYAKVNYRSLVSFGQQAYHDVQKTRATTINNGTTKNFETKEAGKSQKDETTPEGFFAIPLGECASVQPTDAIERITFINIVLTGIVSSLTKGYHQTALAHKLYDGLRSLFTLETAPYLHGELVAIGLLMQVVYNGQPEQAEILRPFMQDLNMPCSLEEIDIDINDAARIESLRTYASPTEFVPADAASRKRFAQAFDTILYND